MSIVKSDILVAKQYSDALDLILSAVRNQTSICKSELRYDSISGLMDISEHSLYYYAKEKFGQLKVDKEENWFLTKTSRLESDIKHQVGKRFFHQLSVYPKPLMAVGLNISGMYTKFRRELDSLPEINLANNEVLELLCLRDVGLALAIIYNAIEDRNIVCVRGEYEGYKYSSVPIYDGKDWVELALDSKLIDSLLTFQGIKLPKTSNRDLKVFIHATS